MNTATAQAILKYPGAKWRLASWLHQYTPHCTRVIDAYCGSAAFALTLPYRPAHLILNDRDDRIVSLFRVLREEPEALLRAVALTPWSRTEYLACAGPAGSIVATGDPVEDARRFLVITWQAHGTTICTRSGWRHKGKTDDLRNLGHTYELWQRLPERLAAVVDVLRDAEIESMPAIDLIGDYATADTLVYADPPYVRQTAHGRRRALYRHEMSDADHLALLDVLDAHPGPVMLSGYDNALYAGRLTHWRRIATQAAAEKGNMRTEVLWLNAAAWTTTQHTLFPRDEEAARAEPTVSVSRQIVRNP